MDIKRLKKSFAYKIQVVNKHKPPTSHIRIFPLHSPSPIKHKFVPCQLGQLSKDQFPVSDYYFQNDFPFYSVPFSNSNNINAYEKYSVFDSVGR